MQDSQVLQSDLESESLQHWERTWDMELNPGQAWGELIVNDNALLMHYFFQVIQGND